MPAAVESSPSLNRAVLAALPGLPDGLGGASAFDLVSGVGIARRAAAALDPDVFGRVPDGFSPETCRTAEHHGRMLATLVEAADPAVLGFADATGAALAGLVATLVAAPAAARAARPEWPAEQWDRWAGIRRLALGGGVVATSFGERMVASAREWLPRLGARDLALWVPADPATLALRGMAATLPDGAVVLVDAGLTAIKARVGRSVGGQCLAIGPVTRTAPAREPRGAALADVLADIAADATATQVEHRPIVAAGFAVATYTDATGQPLPGQAGLYGSLAGIPLAEHLGTRLAERLGSRPFVRTANDGEAAAMAVTGTADAVIMLGTAIGSGFAPRVPSP